MEAVTLGELVRAVGGKLLGPCTDETLHGREHHDHRRCLG